MDIMSVAGFGLVAAVLSVLVRRFGSEYGMLVSLGGCVLILLAVMSAVSPLVSLISGLCEAGGINSAYIGVLLKAVAVCYISGLASDVCRDSGETAIAARIDLAGRIAVLLVSVPLFEGVLSIVKELVG